MTKGKDPKFYWGKDQQEAFEAVKKALSSDPVVLPLNPMVTPYELIVAVDASKTGWGAVLMQVQRGRRHPARYESGMWSETEMNYDAGKREARAALCALKKFRSYLYGVHFLLEIDSKTLVAQLNRSATDLPGAVVSNWLAYMRLFDFQVKHIEGKKHGGPDGLSRKPGEPSESQTEGIDDYILGEMGMVYVAPEEVSIT